MAIQMINLWGLKCEIDVAGVGGYIVSAYASGEALVAGRYFLRIPAPLPDIDECSQQLADAVAGGRAMREIIS